MHYWWKATGIWSFSGFEELIDRVTDLSITFIVISHRRRWMFLNNEHVMTRLRLEPRVIRLWEGWVMERSFVVPVTRLRCWLRWVLQLLEMLRVLFCLQINLKSVTILIECDFILSFDHDFLGTLACSHLYKTARKNNSCWVLDLAFVARIVIDRRPTSHVLIMRTLSHQTWVLIIYAIRVTLHACVLCFFRQFRTSCSRSVAFANRTSFEVVTSSGRHLLRRLFVMRYFFARHVILWYLRLHMWTVYCLCRFLWLRLSLLSNLGE